MFVKVPLDNCFVLNRDEVTLEMVLKNDAFKICVGSVDQFLVSNTGILKGVVSSCDIESASAPYDLDRLINYNPIFITSSRYERCMVESVFEHSPKIRSIPIVDENKHLMYVYRIVNRNLEAFYNSNYRGNGAKFSKEIVKTIEKIKNSWGDNKVVVFTDIPDYNMKLDNSLDKYIMSKDQLDSIAETDLVVLAFLYDFNCLPVIKRIIEKKNRFMNCNIWNRNMIINVTPYYKMDKYAEAVLNEEALNNGNYFDLNDFQNIFQMLKMTSQIEGDYVEIGTYRGDSARAALSYMSKAGIKRKSYFLDTYEGFAYSEAHDSGDCMWFNTHKDTSIEFVQDRLSSFRDGLEYSLIKANIITDDLPAGITKIAVCNIDVDVYEAVWAALQKVKGYIAEGGVIIAEDYGHTPALIGAQYAISTFYEENRNLFYGVYLQSGQFILIRK